MGIKMNTLSKKEKKRKKKLYQMPNSKCLAIQEKWTICLSCAEMGSVIAVEHNPD